MEDFIKTLNIYEYAEFRKACIDGCNISRAAWSQWRTGKVTVPEKYYGIINAVSVALFNRMVFNA